jgi:hypothetical protein
MELSSINAHQPNLAAYEKYFYGKDRDMSRISIPKQHLACIMSSLLEGAGLVTTGFEGGNLGVHVGEDGGDGGKICL